MKLTKDQLIYLFEGKRLAKNKYDMIDELLAGTLDIEGYERVERRKKKGRK